MSSCTAAQLPLILCMISKNRHFGVGGDEKFFTEANFILMTTKFTTLNQKLFSNYLHSNQVDVWNGFLNMIKSVTKSCPSSKSGKQAKNRNLSQLLIIKGIQSLPLAICFCEWQMRCNWLKFLCVSPKTSKSKMATNYGKKNRSRYFASGKNPKLRNLTHTPTHLVCNAHLIATFLSFHMSLVVVMNCGAENVLHGIEISMFWFF